MRNIVVAEFVSLDGVMQAPGAADEDTEGGFASMISWPHRLSRSRTFCSVTRPATSYSNCVPQATSNA